MTRRLKRPIQLELPARTWGGKRPKAGRRKTVGIVLHRQRPALVKREPLHITLRVRRDVASLRTDKCFAQIQEALFGGHEKFGMRMVEFGIESNHIHFVVEADDRAALSRGMQGLIIRLARAINRAQSRSGKVFAERYHARILKTPTEVRNAVEYVRNNHKKHLKKLGRPAHPFYIDPYSSMSGAACWYEKTNEPVVARPQSWMLRRATAPSPQARRRI